MSKERTAREESIEGQKALKDRRGEIIAEGREERRKVSKDRRTKGRREGGRESKDGRKDGMKASKDEKSDRRKEGRKQHVEGRKDRRNTHRTDVQFPLEVKELNPTTWGLFLASHLCFFKSFSQAILGMHVNDYTHE